MYPFSVWVILNCQEFELGGCAVHQNIVTNHESVRLIPSRHLDKEQRLLLLRLRKDFFSELSASRTRLAFLIHR